LAIGGREGRISTAREPAPPGKPEEKDPCSSER
jgi:hypothetical protein